MASDQRNVHVICEPYNTIIGFNVNHGTSGLKPGSQQSRRVERSSNPFGRNLPRQFNQRDINEVQQNLQSLTLDDRESPEDSDSDDSEPTENLNLGDSERLENSNMHGTDSSDSSSSTESLELYGVSSEVLMSHSERFRQCIEKRSKEGAFPDGFIIQIRVDETKFNRDIFLLILHIIHQSDQLGKFIQIPNDVSVHWLAQVAYLQYKYRFSGNIEEYTQKWYRNAKQEWLSSIKDQSTETDSMWYAITAAFGSKDEEHEILLDALWSRMGDLPVSNIGLRKEVETAIGKAPSSSPTSTFKLQNQHPSNYAVDNNAKKRSETTMIIASLTELARSYMDEKYKCPGNPGQSDSPSSQESIACATIQFGTLLREIEPLRRAVLGSPVSYETFSIIQFKEAMTELREPIPRRCECDYRERIYEIHDQIGSRLGKVRESSSSDYDQMEE